MKNQCSTLKDIKAILNGLTKEGNPEDKELIDFYTKKIEVETAKALRKIEVQKMLCPKLY